MNYDPLIHHRRSIRLKGYDYSKAGLYFITVCTHERKFLFGNISSSNDHDPPTMFLNATGKIANECWQEIPKHFPNVILHEHVVMPNHVHGIIEISQNSKLSSGSFDSTVGVDSNETIGADSVETIGTASVETIGADSNETIGADSNETIGAEFDWIVGAENFQPQLSNRDQFQYHQNQFQKIIPRSIGSIVKGFKIGVTKWVRANTEIQNVWQRNYFEIIIRNEKSYQNISRYIIDNPKNWKGDKFYS